MAGKQYLMTPGPTPVPPQVLAALAEPIVHHRGPDFRPTYEWGTNPAAEDLPEALERMGGARVVFLTHSETSTGAVADVRDLAAAAKAAGVLVAVDAISSLGAVPLETDEGGLDAVVSGSQKALMTPPGLALAAPSEAAWRAV